MFLGLEIIIFILLPNPSCYVFIQSYHLHQRLRQYHRIITTLTRPDQTNPFHYLHLLSFSPSGLLDYPNCEIISALVGIKIIIHISIFDLQHGLVLIDVIHQVILILQVTIAMVCEHRDSSIFEYDSGILTIGDCST